MDLKNIKQLRLFGGVIQALFDNPDKKFKPLTMAIIDMASGFKLKESHINTYIRVNSATDVNVTINNPAYLIGHSTTLEQTGEGVITILSDGVSILNGAVTSGEQFKVIQVIKVASNTWTVIGGTA